MADITRDYNFTAGTVINPEEVDSELNQLFARINDLPAEALQSAVADALGLSQPGAVRRGSVEIPGIEARTNVAYGYLGTPDRVDDIVVPTRGLLVIAYSALWKCSVADAGRAAVFLEGVQLKARESGAPTLGAQAAVGNGSFYEALATAPFGLVGGQAGGTYTQDVESDAASGVAAAPAPTGGSTFRHELAASVRTVAVATSLGGSGLLVVRVAPGTYDIGVQFKATSGSVTAKERKLNVWTIG